MNTDRRTWAGNRITLPGFLTVALLVFWTAGLDAMSRQMLPLAGTWRFALDPADEGLREQWFSRRLEGQVRLPGSLPQQGIGDPVTTNTAWTGGIVNRSWFTAPEYEPYRIPGSVKVPFWLQPETVYTGAAWYQRDIDIPAGWEGRRVVLFLERPHWETQVWVDDQLAGAVDTLGTPHEHDLGSLHPGRHQLTIRVDNRRIVDIGENSHSISDHTQGNWNGIVGRIELQSTPPVWLDEVNVYPDLAAKGVLVRWRVGNTTGLRAPVTLTCAVRFKNPPGREVAIRKNLEFEFGPGGGSGSTELYLDRWARPWDEFDPQLYIVRVELRTTDGLVDRREVPFGLREIKAEGTQFTLNGRPLFLRGTLECSIFPRTGHPPVDVESWRKVIRTAQAHGLNHLRFHSHCPPEAAFEAADELGMYLQVEASIWANQTTTLGDGKPVDSWVYTETERILRSYGNHPSFVLMTSGNEPAGARHADFLSQWVEHFKTRDTRRLWSSAAGWPQLPVNQWHSSPDPRVQGWGEGLNSRINGKPPETLTDYRAYIAARSVPVVSHEIGQWCVYPNFDEMRKYTGYLKPRNFEIFQQTLAANGLSHLARPFLTASGRLQTLCYKEDIESALRTPGMAGFQLLDLHDFPGQGTALVGVLDPFWESKGYVSASEFRRFCGPTIPLARLPQRVFTQDQRLEADVDVAHFGPQPITRRKATWALVDDRGLAVTRGVLGTTEIPTGNLTRLGRVETDLTQLPAPARYRLVVSVAGRPAIENDWDLWVYPPNAPTTPPANLRVVSQLDTDAANALENGDRVLWLVPPAQVRPDPQRGPVALGFSSIFWNTAWTGGQAPHTLGILCDPKHPAFAHFPTETHSNWQWWYVVRHAGALILDELPANLEPTVRVIDDWVTARRLALAFEARVGAGKLFVCSVDLNTEAGLDPVRRQFRTSLLNYLGSDRFQPETALSLEQVRSLAKPDTSTQR
jgi:hypothetical protein